MKRGLHIYSTVNTHAQEVIYDEFQDDNNFPWNGGEKETEGAMVITEVGTGKILAMMGGRTIQGDQLFNRTTSPRQPGSSIKPLSVYSAALQKSFDYAEDGKSFEFTNYHIDKQGTSGYGDYITAGSYVKDEPTYINGEKWPLNATRTYSGGRSFRTALQQSINTCAVKILHQVGVDYSIKTLKKYGISTLVTDGDYNDMNMAALGLGAMTEGTTPLEMALAYGVFPNEGKRNAPLSYTEIKDSNGEVVLVGESKEKKVLDEGVAWIMSDLLQSVVINGLGRPASIYDVQVGGKTGTTDQAADLWFCGFTPSYSASLWIGTDDNASMNAMSEVAAGLWGRIMDEIPEVKDGEYKEEPNDVIRKNGEYYTKGTEPSYGYTEPKKKRSSNSSSASSDLNDTENSSDSNDTENSSGASSREDFLDNWQNGSPQSQNSTQNSSRDSSRENWLRRWQNSN